MKIREYLTCGAVAVLLAAAAACNDGADDAGIWMRDPAHREMMRRHMMEDRDSREWMMGEMARDPEAMRQMMESMMARPEVMERMMNDPEMVRLMTRMMTEHPEVMERHMRQMMADEAHRRRMVEVLRENQALREQLRSLVAEAERPAEAAAP